MGKGRCTFTGLFLLDCARARLFHCSSPASGQFLLTLEKSPFDWERTMWQPSRRPVSNIFSHLNDYDYRRNINPTGLIKIFLLCIDTVSCSAELLLFASNPNISKILLFCYGDNAFSKKCYVFAKNENFNKGCDGSAVQAKKVLAIIRS